MVKRFVIIIFFSVQCLGIINNLFVDYKLYCWAPYDQICTYKIELYLDGQLQTDEAVRKRYHVKARGRENRSINNLFLLVEDLENRRSKEKVKTIIHYAVNGISHDKWAYQNFTQ